MTSDPLNDSYVPRHDDADYEHQIPYPGFVTTREQKRRWDRAEDLAESMFADLDPAERRVQVWSAIRVFFFSDMPTGDESERLA
jgi:hypothetical protein